MKKKIKTYLKKFKIMIAREKHFQTAITTTDHNLHFQIILAEDYMIDKNHRTIHKIDN